MKIIPIFIAIVAASALVAGGLFAFASVLFDGRVGPGLQAGVHTMTGINEKDVPSMIAAYEKDILGRSLTFILDEQEKTFNLLEIGISLDKEAITGKIKNYKLIDNISNRSSIEPIPVIDEMSLTKQLGQAYGDIIDGPLNANLRFNDVGQLEITPSAPGNVIDMAKLEKELNTAIIQQDWDKPIMLSLTKAVAEVQNEETTEALAYANQILKEGIELTYDDQSIVMKPFTVKRLIRFVEQIDPNNHANLVLGVKFDSAALNEYLTTTIIPVINKPAQNARFVLNDGRVDQFSLPDEGRELDMLSTVSQIASKLARHERTVPLVANISQPVFTNIDDIRELGLTKKLSTGESDFVGSPKNRVHNISVGASRYHGLLIPPATEFSFNEFLGPVDAATGFKQELVIKENVTTPEYGGGLCQVSTTMFRAALNAGLEITQRRNHSYAVSYYGKPGLDATIYPPYTDLRFLNNTPGYILIQTRIDGTKIAFDFWGTDDNRQVDITGPITYDYQSNGAVKAYVEQRVTLAGETLIDETFYSRYKSPKLFPKVLAANGEASPTVNEVAPQATPSNTPVASTAPKPEEKITDKNNDTTNTPITPKATKKTASPIPSSTD